LIVLRSARRVLQTFDADNADLASHEKRLTDSSVSSEVNATAESGAQRRYRPFDQGAGEGTGGTESDGISQRRAAERRLSGTKLARGVDRLVRSAL
jgi:hypothetical protein